MIKHERSIGGDNGSGGRRRSRVGWLGLLACAWLSTASIGCDKPTAGECKKAILNIRKVLGTNEQSEFASQTGAWVRSCRGSAKRKAVTCAMESASVEALKGCGLISTKEIDELIELDRQLKQLDPTRPGAGATGTVPGTTPPGTGTVPGTGAGAATGTDPGPGSGAGTGTGSGSATAAGSGSGSATGTGTGSATGSAAGSATPPAGGATTP